MLDRRGLYQRLTGNPETPQPAPAFFFGALPLDLAALDDNPLDLLPVPQPHIQRVLDERAAELGVEVRRGHELAGLSQRDDAVLIDVDCPDGRYEMRCRYVVGADGGHSTTRQLAGIGFSGLRNDDVVARTVEVVVPADVVDTATGGLNVPGYGHIPPFISQRTETGVFAFGNLPARPPLMFTVEWNARSVDETVPFTLGEFCESVRRVLGADLPLQVPALRLTRTIGVNTRLAERFSDGRVLLVGDAAHVQFVLGGPGLNLGLQDAINIGWKLAGSIRGWAPPHLLDTYTAERWPAARRMAMRPTPRRPAVEGRSQEATELIKPDGHAFPLAYAHWYAARLFLDAGCPAAEVLRRVGLDVDGWNACNTRYGILHFADTGWVASAFRREGLAAPEDDRALYRHLATDNGIEPGVTEPFSMRAQLAALRRMVEADPHIGPFADVDWVAHYICERRFPTIRYVHNGRDVMVDGDPISDRKGVPLTGVDPVTFRRLADRWFRDATRVYGQGETPTRRFWFVMRGADPETFTVLNERYGVDKAAGYYITNRRLPSEEPGTFEIVSYFYGRGQKPGIHVEESHYAKDSRKVYAYGVAIEGADAPSFQSIGDEGKYFADRNRIYWERTPIAQADRQTFTCASLAGQYRAYDKNGPYYAGEPQSVTAEYERWQEFFERHPGLADTWWHREKARRDTVSGDERADARPSSLGGPYFSDGTRILVRPERRRDGEWVSLDHFDVASFRHIVDIFGCDRHGLRYFLPGLEKYGRDPVEGADPASFQALGDGWYRDARHAYYLDVDTPTPELAIVKADLASFEILGGAYARDAKGLLVEGVRKRGIDDPAAVVALGRTFARMGDAILYRGKPVTRPGKVNPATARGVHSQLLIDDNGHMLLAGRYRKPVPGLDPASFRFLNRAFAVDDDGVYGMTQDALIACEEADRASIEADGPYAVRDRGARFHVSGSSVHRTNLSTAEGR